MISLLFYSVLAIASLYALAGGKKSLGALLLIGFLQDVVRKLTPGEPVIFVVTVGILFGFILLSVWGKRGLLGSFEPFLKWTANIWAPLSLFLAILLIQLIHSVLRYNNLIVGLIGLITYIAPFLGVVVGYYLVNSIQDIKRFMWLYIGMGVLVAMSVVLAFSGVNWTILNEVGEGIKIYDQGTVLKSYAGLMRTGEVAAWHISTAACLMMALAFSSEKSKNLPLVLVIVALMMLAVALTGRRKMLMLTSLFTLFYLMVLFFYKRHVGTKYFQGVLYAVLAMWLGYEWFTLDGYDENLGNYIARSSTVFGDASGRFVELGINPIQWAYERVGLLGGGLGVASQGAYLFQGTDIAGGSGEGGLGKIMVELGLPGLVCIVWLGWAMARYVNSGLRLLSQPFIAKPILPMMVSCSVLLGVNAVTFTVATQVYSDLFILIMLGIFGGFLMALPKIVVSAAEQEFRYSARQFNERAKSPFGKRLQPGNGLVDSSSG